MAHAGTGNGTGQLVIGQGVIRCGSTVYPLANIASFDTVRIPSTAENPISEKAAFWCGLIAFFCFLALFAEGDAGGKVGAFFIGAGCGYVVYRWMSWQKPGDEYGLQIVNNARHETLVRSKNQAFIEEIKERIIQAIAMGPRAPNLTVNLANEMVVDQRSTTVNVFQINPQPAAFTAAQLQVVRDAVAPAIRELAVKLEALSATRELEDLKKLVSELNSAHPTKGSISMAWERVKTAKDIYEVGKLVLDAGSAVGKLLGLM